MNCCVCNQTLDTNHPVVIIKNMIMAHTECIVTPLLAEAVLVAQNPIAPCEGGGAAHEMGAVEG